MELEVGKEIPVYLLGAHGNEFGCALNLSVSETFKTPFSKTQLFVVSSNLFSHPLGEQVFYPKMKQEVGTNTVFMWCGLQSML